MKKERFFWILGEVDEDLIDKAEDNKGTVSPKINLKRWAAIAACVVLAVGIGFIMTQNNNTILPNDDELPLLSLDIDGSIGGGMGFEGYMAYDISELKNENPWTEERKISHLPVFENTMIYEGARYVSNSDIKVMEKILTEVAGGLGMDVTNLEITNDYPDEETIKMVTEKYAAIERKVPAEFFCIGSVLAEDKGIKFEVDARLVTTIRFEPSVSLPEEYNFTHYSSYNDKYKVVEYLQEEYKDFLNMKNSKININGGDYSYDSNQVFHIEFFDNSGDVVDRIINYNFNYVTFGCNDERSLFISRVYKSDLSKKIGDYPIITPQKANELLINGNYITTVPENFPGKKFIRKTEIVYRTGSTEKLYLPYYRIYVEMPTMKLENGLNTYGAYYVPAVEEKYITNMPLWKGSFN